MKKLIAIAMLAFASSTLHAETPSAPAAPPAAPAAPATPAEPAPAAPAARREEKDGAQSPTWGDRIRAFKNAHAGTAALTVQIEAITIERDTARNELATIRAERDNLRQQIAEIEAALGEQRQTVKATAASIVESIGIPQAQLPAPRGEAETNKTKTRAEFEALAPADRMAFIREGGSIQS